jgi:FtsP/CotA-like multicopper oxidase with cupredoxin domain
MTTTSDLFPTDAAGLTPACAPIIVDVADGEELTLRITPVAKKLGDDTVRMLAYNGSVPGPVLRVRQGTEIVVHAVNCGDLDATVHWHGLRLDNEYDGTTETQAPIPIGGRFTYRLSFPDPGIYWYHPHIREDYGQEMGLAGTIIVAPSAPGYWPEVDREISLVLDDVLLEDGRIAPFSRSETTFVAMGRFGNVLLANGEPNLQLGARQGEIVRCYLVNTANTRVFNVGIPGARMKLVGGDSGRYEREQIVDGVILAPSERAIVDVFLEEAGALTLEHRTPNRTYTLATLHVAAAPHLTSVASRFDNLRTNVEMVAERERVGPLLTAAPDKTVALVAEMDMGEPELPVGATLGYSCPMHPEVISSEPGRCPKCGMKLLATAAAPVGYACPMHPEVTSDSPDRCPHCGMKLVPAQLVAAAAADYSHGDEHGHDHHTGGDHNHDTGGIEWEDDMLEVNRVTTSANMRWKLVDRDTGAEGHAIDWCFRVGDQVKIRIVNEMDSDHPMHHPFHIHGAGRFLILARDGITEPNLVWKDTVLVPTGQTVDILLDVTNAGVWMAHCHIAEHHESGMMLNFTVDP